MFRLLQYFKPYKGLLGLSLLSNLLMSLFMVVSIPVLQPFLQILFSPPGQEAPRISLTAPGSGKAGFQAVEQQVNSYFTRLIAEHGREEALLIVCGFLVLTFLGKNLFRYLSLYFLAPLRNSIVRD
ncbi:MAG: ABC transporter ATP-binding protein, partial [Saprospiraceae bacterium]|nr:ABC transporter ATP-binding protein [Saprospiraceae bacterium]